MVKIAITGIASTLARAVVPHLLADANIEMIIGVDIRQPDYFKSEKYEFHQVDVRDLEGLKRAFGKIDVLLHLAFIVVDNIPDCQTIDAININGSKNAFQAAVAGGARKIIHLSSVAAYGMSLETPPLITEETPLRGGQDTGFYYSYTKAIVEQYLDQFVKDHPQVCITRFRPHVIQGPQFASHTTNFGIVLDPLRKGGNARTLKLRNGERVLLQLTHEDDLAEAIALAIRRDLPGAFNIASSPLDHINFLRQRGLKVSEIPIGLLKFGIAVGSVFSKRVREKKAWVSGIQHQIVVSSAKLQSVGFTFKYPTTESCVEDILKITKC
jgi:UDP-glucose 4-epimerase